MFLSTDVQEVEIQFLIKELRHESAEEITGWIQGIMMSLQIVCSITDADRGGVGQYGEYFLKITALLDCTDPPPIAEILDKIKLSLWDKFKRFVPVMIQAFVRVKRTSFCVEEGTESEYIDSVAIQKKKSGRPLRLIKKGKG